MGVSCYELEFEEIKKKVLDSINELYFKDYYIIDNDVNERSITHKLWNVNTLVDNFYKDNC